MARWTILGVVVALAGRGWVDAQSAQAPAAAQAAPGPPSRGVTIHQEGDLDAPPERIYEALLDTRKFEAFSLAHAEINREVGGAFTIFDGHIVGRNVELVPNRRIVQAWRVVDWPEGVYSIARFDLTPREKGTHLVLDHTGFPEALKDHLAAGWTEHYWERLRKYLAS